MYESGTYPSASSSASITRDDNAASRVYFDVLAGGICTIRQPWPHYAGLLPPLRQMGERWPLLTDRIISTFQVTLPLIVGTSLTQRAG